MNNNNLNYKFKSEYNEFKEDVPEKYFSNRIASDSTKLSSKNNAQGVNSTNYKMTSTGVSTQYIQPNEIVKTESSAEHKLNNTNNYSTGIGKGYTYNTALSHSQSSSKFKKKPGSRPKTHSGYNSVGSTKNMLQIDNSNNYLENGKL